MIQTYYGTGKGKSSAAVGVAIRAAGSGMKVLFIQFFKNGDSSECAVLKELAGVDFALPEVGYTLFEKPDPEIFARRAEAYRALLLGIDAPKYDMIVLDEVLDVLALDYLDETVFLDWALGLCCELVLTGHSLPDGVAAASDYLSEIKAIKHPYDSGAPARKGIEY